jgi:hypothetical protein
MGRRAVIACKLDVDEVSRRRASWRRVREQVEVVERTSVPGGFLISFRGPRSAIEAVENLVASERECCSWADWQVRAIGDCAVLYVTGPEALIEPLARVFGVTDSRGRQTSSARSATM